VTEATNQTSFDKIVEWAYNTLPQKIRALPDFPGIQIVDEPPAELFEKISKKRNWHRGHQLLGCYSGVKRTQRRYCLVRISPELIFVFRGPILRCSKGNLPAEVKQVVWHEVAHWLGHDEEEVKELGLSRSFKELVDDQLENEVSKTVPQESLSDSLEAENEAPEQLRCIKCYSENVVCRELDRPSWFYGARLTVHAKVCTCGSCGHEWDDEDNY